MRSCGSRTIARATWRIGKGDVGTHEAELERTPGNGHWVRANQHGSAAGSAARAALLRRRAISPVPRAPVPRSPPAARMRPAPAGPAAVRHVPGGCRGRPRGRPERRGGRPPERPWPVSSTSAAGRPAAARSARRRSSPAGRRGPFLGSPSGASAVEGMERDLGMNLVDPPAHLRPLPQQRVDRADVAEDVVALDRGREGRVAGGARGGLGGRIVGRVDGGPRRHREDRRPRRLRAGRARPGRRPGRRRGSGRAGRSARRSRRQRGCSGASRSAATSGNRAQRCRAGIVEVDQRARPGAPAAVQSRDPARHRSPLLPVARAAEPGLLDSCPPAAESYPRAAGAAAPGEA